jgi:hypothetical protein
VAIRSKISLMKEFMIDILLGDTGIGVDLFEHLNSNEE